MTALLEVTQILEGTVTGITLKCAIMVKLVKLR